MVANAWSNIRNTTLRRAWRKLLTLPVPESFLTRVKNYLNARMHTVMGAACSRNLIALTHERQVANTCPPKCQNLKTKESIFGNALRRRHVRSKSKQLLFLFFLLLFSVVSICFHLLTQRPHYQRAIFLCFLSLNMHKTFLTVNNHQITEVYQIVTLNPKCKIPKSKCKKTIYQKLWIM